jgi:hypothetical protein
MCQKFASEYEKIANDLSEQKRADGTIVVGKIDATTNEVEQVVDVCNIIVFGSLIIFILGGHHKVSDTVPVSFVRQK